MPLLKRETEVFPRNIFELSQGDLPWWVAHVRSRQEKALARYLEPLGVAFYLPQRECRILRSGRTFVSYLPLFSGYVFFRGSKAERYAALQSNLIVRVLDVLDQDLLEGELRQLRALQESGASLTPIAYLGPGDPVRVVEGPFEGYRGVVVQERGRLRLVVSITMLRKAVAVEFEKGVLAPVVSRHDRIRMREERSVSLR